MIAWTAAEADGTAGAVWTLGFLLLCLLLSSWSATGWVEFYPLFPVWRRSQRGVIDATVCRTLVRFSFLSELSLYEVTIHVSSLRGKEGGGLETRSRWKRAWHRWRARGLLGLVTFSRLLLCLPLGCPTQTRTMSATSEGKHVWGPRKVDLFSFFVFDISLFHRLSVILKSCVHPSPLLLPSLPRPSLPQCRLPRLTFHGEHTKLPFQLWSLSNGKWLSCKGGVTTEKWLTQGIRRK